MNMSVRHIIMIMIPLENHYRKMAFRFKSIPNGSNVRRKLYENWWSFWFVFVALRNIEE